MNNISIQLNDVRLIFSTLWSKISPVNEWQIERSISDFQVVKFNGHFFSVSNFNQLHSDSLNFIEKELSQNNAGKTVVVSHHVPTFFLFSSYRHPEVKISGFWPITFALHLATEFF